MNLFLYISYYFLILFSIIGFGYWFKYLFLSDDKNDLGFFGIYGTFSLIIISYFSNYFLPHDLIFNSILLIIGLVLFILFLKKNYTLEKKNIRFLLTIFIILSIATFSAKNHDDFPYYHFQYIHLLTSSNLSIGIGQFNHGFRTPSSIFYLSSLFYLPKVNFQLVHLAPIYFLGFANFIFLKKIFKFLDQRKNLYLVIFSILSLALINIFFYRLAEHGTDRSAQILILLLIFELIILINLKNKIITNNLSKILILCTITISLKVFYFIYLSLMLIIINNQKNFFNVVSEIIKNKVSYLCILLIAMLFLTNLLNTGCFIYPMSVTCILDSQWSIPLVEVKNMNQWYQQWSKAGATPNFAIENPEIYIQNFNWVSNWVDVYFFNKVSDYLFGLIFLIVLFFIFFEKKTQRKYLKRNFWSIYLILLFLLFEWFYFHPALRYGGYHLIALLIFIPFSVFMEKQILMNKKNIKRIKIFISLIFIIFFVRNIDRIYNEHKIYNYNPVKYPSYNIEFNNLNISSRIINIKSCYKGLECQKDNIQLKKKYIFDIFTKK